VLTQARRDPQQLRIELDAAYAHPLVRVPEPPSRPALKLVESDLRGGGWADRRDCDEGDQRECGGDQRAG
jgi:hypothetical protein